MRSILRALGWAVALAPLACTSGSSAPDGSSPGMCSAGVPPGQACSTLQNIASPITPTCVTGTMPNGAGGTILDGTYVLASQTYYNDGACPMTPLSETVVISGGCIQLAFDASGINATGSTTFVVQGDSITTTTTCLDLGVDAGPPTMDAGTKTFTATATTFTLFTLNSAGGSPNPDRVETFTKR